MAKVIESAVMPSLPFFIDCSEGESGAPVASSHCYRPAQHNKRLIPQNFQPLGRQNIRTLIVSVQKGLLLRLLQGQYGDNKVTVP